MAYEVPYDSNYGEWYGTPQDVTRLSAVLEQTTDEDGNSIGMITASWDMPDNGGTFVAQLSTDGENFYIAENDIRQNSVILAVEPSTDYYLKIVTVLGGNQSDGTVSNLLSTDIPTPNAPIVTVTPSGLRINVGIIPKGYTASISIDDGESVDYIETSEIENMYLCNAGEYEVAIAFMDVNGTVGTYSSAVTVTLDNNVYNLKTPLITSYIIVDDGGDYYTDTAGEVILQEPNHIFKKYNNLPAIAGIFNRSGYRSPLVVSTIQEAVTIQRGDATPTTSQGSFETNGVVWYYCACTDSNSYWNSTSVAENFPIVDNGTRYESILNASKKLVEEANPTLFPTETIEENLFYPTDVTISSGDTITDNTLKSLIAYHRPITVNGTVFTPSDFTNGTYTYYALQNGTDSTEIKKAQINSSWVITITTESAGGGSSYTAGDGIDITSDTISLEKATTKDIGGVIVGSGLSIDADGVLSATGGGGGGAGGIASGVQKDVLYENASLWTTGSVVLSNTLDNYDLICFEMTTTDYPQYSSQLVWLVEELFDTSHQHFNLFENGTRGFDFDVSSDKKTLTCVNRVSNLAVRQIYGIKFSKNLTEQMYQSVLWEDANGWSSGTITLNDSIRNYDFIQVCLKEPNWGTYGSPHSIFSVNWIFTNLYDNKPVISMYGYRDDYFEIFVESDTQLSIAGRYNYSAYRILGFKMAKGGYSGIVTDARMTVKSGTYEHSSTVGGNGWFNATITFDSPMPDTNYEVLITRSFVGNSWASIEATAIEKTINGFTLSAYNVSGSATSEKPKFDWIAIRPNSYTREGMVEDILFSNASGVNSGTINLSGNISDYDFVVVDIWDGNNSDGGNSVTYLSSSILHPQSPRGIISTRYHESYIQWGTSNGNTINIIGSGDSGKIFKIKGIKFAKYVSGVKVDTTVTQNSSNVVTSGAVYDYIASLEARIQALENALNS